MIEFEQTDILDFVSTTHYPLIIADPPYSHIVSEKWDWKHASDVEHAAWMIEWTNLLSNVQETGDVLYVWGGTGTPKNRAFFRYLVALEYETDYRIKNYITWAKKRAYGVKDNYLFTREECLYLIKGTDKPNVFHIPLLEEERGYVGYNKKYPAKSKFKRRTNVWTDVTEKLRDKVHPTEKAQRLAEIMIETHTKEGDWVLDPFAGSGSTGIAADALGRNCRLMENDPKIFEAMVLNVKEKQK